MGDNCWNVPWMGVRRPTARRVEIEGRPMNHPRHSDPAEQSAFMRLFYRNWRPTRLGQRVNRFRAGCRSRAAAEVPAVLEVRGRKSGRRRSNPVVIATVGARLPRIDARPWV